MWIFPLLMLACGDSSEFKPPIEPRPDTGSNTTTPADGEPGQDTSEPGQDTSEPGQDTSEPTGSDSDDTAESCAETSSSVTHTIDLDPSIFVRDTARTLHNPLKGFMSSYLWGEPVSGFPDQMEFLYLPMNTLWDESGDLLDTGLEPYLAAAETRGHHAVLRVFMDYPTRASGVPDYLSSTVSCNPYTEHGGGCSPDYDHPDLVAAMVGLIEALGERYDGDPRLGYVQVGLLGFWGEWHTWPHSEWFPSDATQTTILEAYTTAFPTTHLQIRRAAVGSVGMRLGFHDDSFAHSTLGEIDWFFLPGLITAGAADRWKEVTIGGELRPELQSSVFSDAYVLGDYAQDMTECIEQTHASYLLNYYAYNGDGHGYLGEDRIRAEEAAILMGYQFEIESASATASGLFEDTIDLNLDITLKQSGVAPFYYPLSVSIESDDLASPVETYTELHTLLPGETQTITVALGRVSTDVINNPLDIELSSPMLLSSQQITLATTTDASPAAGPTTLQWAITCDGEPLGSRTRTDSEGCSCICDVDGLPRSHSGDVCE